MEFVNCLARTLLVIFPIIRQTIKHLIQYSMVSIQIDTSGRIYYASRLNYYTVEKVGNEELYVYYDMVSVRYKLDKYDRIVYTESRYLPYHQHGEVQVYTGANAAGAITIMSGSLLNNFVADLVDLLPSPQPLSVKKLRNSETICLSLFMLGVYFCLLTLIY